MRLSLRLAALSAALTCVNAADVYLYPAQRADVAHVSGPAAASILARHLDIPHSSLGSSPDDPQAWNWIKHQSNDAASLFDDLSSSLLLTIHGADEDVVPSRLHFTHKVASQVPAPAYDSLLADFGSKLATIVPSTASSIHLAADAVHDKFSELKPAFEDEIRDLKDFFQSLTQSSPSHSALGVHGLQSIYDEHGASSPEYKTAKSALESVLDAGFNAWEAVAGHNGRNAKFAVVTTSPLSGEGMQAMRRSLEAQSSEDLLRHFAARQARPSPFVESTAASSSTPLSDSKLIGSCFKSADELDKATNQCSGNGKARQSRKGGKACWRCACGTSGSKKGKTVQWAGPACSKPDVSSPFLLLAVTTLALISVSLWGVYTLMSEGNKELPSVLAGISIPTKGGDL